METFKIFGVSCGGCAATPARSTRICGTQYASNCLGATPDILRERRRPRPNRSTVRSLRCLNARTTQSLRGTDARAAQYTQCPSVHTARLHDHKPCALPEPRDVPTGTDKDVPDYPLYRACDDRDQAFPPCKMVAVGSHPLSTIFRYGTSRV